ncbi:alpha/beta hydrolase [Phytohabitans rumicis]|uniref:Alpha/beta hydrolase n=1 Tax=Phytohabitans rumicis TaxID=1076125 RepID=A0A6V8KXN1_9ACTN|nr:alpha/beta hydrolase [Phytohabitans rumicis]GFJ87448.1 alpha/beta hydrolase [Phytohabitans rumicis]
MRTIRRLLATITIVSLAALALAPTTVQAAPATRYDGTLPNGATWIADVPANWNGTLLLYSHGYNPTPNNPPVNSPGPAAAEALLARGYALAGSSYSRSGWVTDTAASDGLDTLRAVTALIGQPRRAIALGTSFGGMITGQLAERGGRWLDGAIATCGLMGGGIDLHNYQLDGSHAVAQLLLAGEQVKLVRFTDTAEAFATAGRMVAALDQAQASPAGRARVALITALYQEPTWVPGQPKPAPGDIEAQVAGQYQNLRTILPFIVAGRSDMERSAGGNPTWNKGVDYGRQLAESGRLAEVAQIYRRAGIDLRADLKLLTHTATVTADPAAYRWMRNSTLTGRLDMPVLTLHTTDDGLVPVQHEEEYAEDVHDSRSAALLRQAYAEHAGHCTFTTAELVAAVVTMENRIQTGRWDGLAEPHRMQALADSLGLGSAAFIRFRVPEFLGDRPAPPRYR